jgi:hypothetical protein
MNLRIIAVLFLGFGLLLTAAPTTGYAQVQTGADQVILTHSRLQHIIERHWSDSTATGAGKFEAGLTVDGLRDMINEAVRNGRARHNTHVRGRSMNTIFSVRSARQSMEGRLRDSA